MYVRKVLVNCVLLFVASFLHFSRNKHTRPDTSLLSILPIKSLFYSPAYYLLSHTMHSLHSIGAAALQRHQIKEKMGAILLENDPSAVVGSGTSFSFPFSSSHRSSSTEPTAASSMPVDPGKFSPSQYQTAVQSGGQGTAEVATPKTLPFPDPFSSRIGLEGMTQTLIIDKDDNISSPVARKRHSPPSQSAAEVNDSSKRRQSINSQLRSLTITKSSSKRRGRGPQRQCNDKETSNDTETMTSTHLGDIYDMQLDRRATKSNKRLKTTNHAVPPTTRGRRKTKTNEKNETSADAKLSLLSPVKRCLYQNDDSSTSVDRSDDEDPFATIGRILGYQSE